MNATQKKFITKKLIPFILREKGRGFVMDYTLISRKPGELVWGDGIERAVPHCGTVGCIKGSIQYLKKVTETSSCAEVLGITFNQAYGLFYHWSYIKYPSDQCHWPKKFMLAFDKSKTTQGKARVVTRLLGEVIRTNGECLNPRGTIV